MVSYEGISEYAVKKMLDHLMGRAAWTMPTTVSLALYNGDPLAGGTELVAPPATGYARVAITCSAATFTSPTGTILNSADIDFGTAGSVWGVVNYIAIFDQLGNMLYSGPLEVTRSIQLYDPVSFPASELKVRASQTIS